MAAGRHHSMPLPPAAASSTGKIRFSLASSSSSVSATSPVDAASVLRGDKAHPPSAGPPGGSGSSAGSRGDAGERIYGVRSGSGSGRGGGSGNVRDYDQLDRDRERERSRSDSYSVKEGIVRDGAGGSGLHHHHNVRYSGRDGVVRDLTRDVARDSARDSVRDLSRDVARDSARDSVRDSSRELIRDSGRETARDGVRDSGRDSAREFLRDGTRDFGRDSLRELTRDAPRDFVRDPGREVTRDALRDFGRDPGREVTRDATRDSGRESARESARDSARDSVRVPIRDFSRDSSRETYRDAARDSTRDSARDIGRDTSRDLGRELSREAGRDAGRDGVRDVGRDVGKDAGRDFSRDGGRDYRSRNSSHEEISAKDSSRQSGLGAVHGKERDRVERYREWEQNDRGRERISRDRERDRKERDLTSVPRPQQPRRISVSEGGEQIRPSSPSPARPPSAGGSSGVLPSSRNLPSPGPDLKVEKDDVVSGDSRSMGPRAPGKDAESEHREQKEPGGLLSGRRLEDSSSKLELPKSIPAPVGGVRKSQSMEADGSRSPAKKRKFSPIVWDYDENQQRSSMVSSKGASSVSPTSKLDGALGSARSPSALPTLPSQPSNNATPTPTPPKAPSSAGPVTPTDSSGTRGSQRLSSSPRESTPSPAAGHMEVSPEARELASDGEVRDMKMQDEPMSSPVSDDEPEPGQLLTDRDDTPVKRSPAEFNDESTLPSLTIGKSRWAGETGTPEDTKSPRGSGKRLKKHSSSLDSDDEHGSVGREGGNLTSGPSTSPEPGEYIQEKADAPRSKERNNDSDGSVGQGSVGKNRRSNSIEDEEYERELNKRELMELEEDDSDADEEIQRPYVDSESEELPPQVPDGPQSRGIDMLQGCRSVDEFERLNKIDEGTYGVVYRAKDKKTGEIVALKMVKMEKEKEGFPMTSLREINVLLSFHHPAVVDVKEVVVGSSIDKIYMVMEYMEHDLKGLMETMKQPFSQSEVKCLMLQLLEGVKYLHDNWVLHRDLKTSNLLLNNRGELKICDFGLARQYGSPLKAYTHMVVTLWYRAPELLLGPKNYQYSTAIDMWSVGCIMAEFLAKEPLFNGKSEIDQIDKIFKTLGTPNEKIWPDFANMPIRCNFVRQPYNKLRERFPATAFSGRPTLSERGFDLLKGLLYYDPRKRLTADDALKHDWFREVPLPKSKEFMPTFPARSEHERRVRRLLKSPDPLEEQRTRETRQAELGGGGLFG